MTLLYIEPVGKIRMHVLLKQHRIAPIADPEDGIVHKHPERRDHIQDTAARGRLRHRVELLHQREYGGKPNHDDVQRYEEAEDVERDPQNDRQQQDELQFASQNQDRHHAGDDSKPVRAREGHDQPGHDQACSYEQKGPLPPGHA